MSSPADSLSALVSATLESELRPGASYRLERRIGEGGIAVAFFALRSAPEGICPVVIKVIRPEALEQVGPAATTSVQKEVVALGRLNERVPPTPYVVRFIDTGSITIPGYKAAVP